MPDAYVRQEGWREDLNVESKRFQFYKVRVHGVLQLVKEPKPEYASDLLTLESLRKEFTLCYGLVHDGIPRYYSYADNKVYEEYIEGDTLRSLIDKRDPRLADNDFIGSLCRQLLDVLGYIHSRGIVHLDIKPENLLISTLGASRLKLIDFGAAVSAESDTTPGFTPGHVSPEQKDGKINSYTDIYQAGLLMREIAAIGGNEKKWKKFIERATARVPRARFASCREALGYIPRKKHRGALFRAAWIAFALLMVAAGIAVGWFVRTGEDSGGDMVEVAVNSETAPVEAAADEAPNQQEASPGEAPSETETVSVKATENASTVPAPRGGDSPIERRKTEMKKEIDRYVKNACEEKISPVIRGAHCDESGTLSQETVKAYREATIEVYNRCQGYAKQLEARSPELEEYVKIEMRRILEEQLGVWYERYAQKSASLQRVADGLY